MVAQKMRRFWSQRQAKLEKRAREERKDWRRDAGQTRQWIAIFGTVIGTSFIAASWFVTTSRDSDRNEMRESLKSERELRILFEKSEKEEREKFQSELKERVLGKSNDANILLRFGGKNLEGMEVKGQILEYWPKPEDWDRDNMVPYAPFQARLFIDVKNTSDFFAGETVVFLYLKKPIACSDCTPITTSPDQSSNTYDYVAPSKGGGINNLPGQVELPMTISFPLFKVPDLGIYPMIIRMHYGKGKVTSAEFRVHFDGTFIPHEDVVRTPR